MLSLLVATALAADPQCESAYGTTVCGYHCVAAYGEVKCAQTEQGTCEAAYGKVTCWDPQPTATVTTRPGPPRFPRDPGFSPQVAAGRPALPPSECKTAYGTTVCGYHCVEAYGTIKCAQTPQGACAEAYGNITCWDPQRWLPPDAPAGMCKEAYGKIVCGYGCVEAYGNIQCAQTPQGTCSESYGTITCWDPPER